MIIKNEIRQLQFPRDNKMYWPKILEEFLFQCVNSAGAKQQHILSKGLVQCGNTSTKRKLNPVSSVYKRKIVFSNPNSMKENKQTKGKKIMILVSKSSRKIFKKKYLACVQRHKNNDL